MGALTLDAAGCLELADYAASNRAGRKIVAGGIEVFIDTHRVKANGAYVLLRPAEFRLLLFFMIHAERVYGRSQLVNEVWSKRVVVGERTVDVHIRRLRAALAPFGLEGLIQTVHGRGYRFSGIRF